MSSRVRRGLLVAALHVAIVVSLGGKLLIDRAVRPRVWARTGPVDPNLPIRGRYVQLRLEAAPEAGWTVPASPASVEVELREENGRLVAGPSRGTDVYARALDRDGQRLVVLHQPLAYFIPEHVPDPSIRPAGEELWVEVTLPRRGLPRPITLGVRKDGALTPLEFN